MTSPTGPSPTRASRDPGDAGPPGGAPRSRAGGFTLIELILVMALLVIAVGVTYPALKGFFHGRVLDAEAHRLLALSRYGQTRAVTEGVPMLLWIDARTGTYGLEASPGYLDQDDKAVEFELDDDLELEVSRDTLRSGERVTGLATVDAPRSSPSLRSAVRTLTGLPAIQLLPDGFIGDTSPEFVKLLEGEVDARWLVQNTNRLGYELRSEEPPAPLALPRR